MSAIIDEIRHGRRFEFGKNWSQFASNIDEERIRVAGQSLHALFECDTFAGKRFLDIGCGSGLFSLAARLGGARVHSFDYDPQSVACTLSLKARYLPHDHDWTIEEGSVLDAGYLERLSPADMVYAWGVLHHTGALWKALENVTIPVASGGFLCVALYNDEGAKSRVWNRVKQIYCANCIGRWSVMAAFIPYFGMRSFLSAAMRGEDPIRQYGRYKIHRGMSMFTDWLDWLGGYPFEVSKPNDVITKISGRGFAQKKYLPCRASRGINEFVFERVR